MLDYFQQKHQKYGFNIAMFFMLPWIKTVVF